jgi:hypothetical protein
MKARNSHVTLCEKCQKPAEVRDTKVNYRQQREAENGEVSRIYESTTYVLRCLNTDCGHTYQETIDVSPL